MLIFDDIRYEGEERTKVCSFRESVLVTAISWNFIHSDNIQEEEEDEVFNLVDVCPSRDLFDLDDRVDLNVSFCFRVLVNVIVIWIALGIV